MKLKIKPLGLWHKWFAWYPVVVFRDGEFYLIFLKSIDRRFMVLPHSIEKRIDGRVEYK